MLLTAILSELLLPAIFNASELIHLAPRLLLQSPGDFFYVLSEHQIGYTFATNSFLDMACATFHEKETKLDFGQLRVLMVGGEANRVNTLQKADEILRKNGGQSRCIKAAYGLSEVLQISTVLARGLFTDGPNRLVRHVSTTLKHQITML